MRSSFTLWKILVIIGVIVSGVDRQYHVINAAEVTDVGSVIFIHPDGAGASTWNAMRILHYGPDSMSYWDRLERLGMYRSHLLNSTNSSSNGGATIHSYGVKVPYNTFGSMPTKPIVSLSGKSFSIMVEAQKAGLATALINSGHICEPGTAVFVANSVERENTDTISEQVIYSGVDIIFSGGEDLLTPEGFRGRHGGRGIRKDKRNLIEEAVMLGYTVIYNRAELLALDPNVDKVLGVFASRHTFNDNTEEYLNERNLPLYNPDSPTLAEMTEVALKILHKKGKRFLLVIEEEGTDNFSNYNNARGTLEAVKRADDAISKALQFLELSPSTLILTTADSEAGGMELVAIRDSLLFNKPLPPNTDNGAPLDGVMGSGTAPFIAKPDRHGNRLRFGVCWATRDDVGGGVIARAHGLNSQLLQNNVDNTDIYRLMYLTLFGAQLPGKH